MISNLDKIKKNTVIVADTGDIDLIKQIKPQDATTNPSLILKSINKRYKSINEAIVDIGCQIYHIVPGYISSEVDANYSFDTNETVREALEIISLYKKAGVDTSRILIKIAATWQGIQAAKLLEEYGIKCNLTLIFSLTQAIACAEANVTLISPFVGRVTDYYKANNILYNEDPGVLLVKSIYKYFKEHNYKTIIMGASFRNIEQICRLNGCDRLTISPQLILELEKTCDDIHTNLSDTIEADTNEEKRHIDENTFYVELAENVMASTKLNEGITKFIKDTETLKKDWIV